MNIAITKSDAEHCHELGKSSRSNIVRFANWKNCYAILSWKFETSKVDNSKLGFEPNVNLYVSGNVTPYNQHLTCNYTELNKAGVIHSSWSSKDVIKYKLVSNETPISIDHEDRIAVLYLDFVFK